MKESLRALRLLLIGLTAVTYGTAQLHAQPAQQQLKVVEHVWGFDGRVQPGQFNPLSILLDNQTDAPIDATATLQRIHGMLTTTGGQYAQPVFIAPTARRWIQFYPYVSDSHQCEWQLSFDGKKIVDFQQPRPAWKLATDKQDQPPQVVILDKDGRESTQPASVKHMPENIFPPYATVTFGLHTVFLDHMPDWELPRQEAFMSWLRQGGRLHILKDSRNEFPPFSGSMLDLNQPLERFVIGSGIVVRHTIQRNEVTEELVRRSTVVNVLKDEDAELEKAIQEQLYNQSQGIGAFVETEPSSIDETFFRQMRELTLPEHAWWLIFLLAMCYIGLIFPGCFALSRKKNIHFLATYGAIVGLSVVFSVLFLLIGRRGYGETTTLQTLAVARAEDNSHWNVLQWNALFVTSGDNYSASVENQQAVLSTGDTMDRSDAISETGTTAQIKMRIPPFSSQTFVSRRRVKSAPWNLKIQEMEFQTTGLVNLKITISGDVPVGKETVYMVMSGRHVYVMKRNEQTKMLELFGKRRALAEFCQPNYTYDYVNPWGSPQQSNERSEQEMFFEDAIRMLIQRSLLDDLVNKPARFELPADRLRLLVYSEIPESFDMQINAEVKQTGRILFTKDIFLNGGPAQSQ